MDPRAHNPKASNLQGYPQVMPMNYLAGPPNCPPDPVMGHQGVPSGMAAIPIGQPKMPIQNINMRFPVPSAYPPQFGPMLPAQPVFQAPFIYPPLTMAMPQMMGAPMPAAPHPVGIHVQDPKRAAGMSLESVNLPSMPLAEPEVTVIPKEDPILTTVYITSIANGVGAIWMKKILSCCGVLCSWKHITDGRGSPLGFGFAVYETTKDLFCALNVLSEKWDISSLSTSGIKILSPVNKTHKRIKMIIDERAGENLRKYLEGANVTEIEKSFENMSWEVKKVLSKLEETVADGTHQVVNTLLECAMTDSELMTARQQMLLSNDILDDTSEGISAERRETIMQEINIFRQRSIKQDLAMREESLSRKDSDSHRLLRESRRKTSEPLYKANIKMHPALRNDIDEEELKLRRKRREKELHQAYLDRLDAWKDEEEARIEMIWHLNRKNKKYENMLVERLATLKEDLASWDNDLSYGSLESRYFFWEKYCRKRTSGVFREEQERKIETKDPPVSESEEFQESTPKVETIVEEEEGTTLGRIMTREERQAACKQLEELIPTTKEQLAEWAVKWNQLDDIMIDEILYPWVSEKIKGYVGTDDVKDLIEFSVDLIKKNTPLDEMIEEFNITLDEDAEEFALLFLRKIIYETESKYRGLT